MSVRSPNHSRSTQKNHTKVYTIGGHGDNGTKRFIVPKGCTIVVREHTGNPAYDFTKDINKLCLTEKEDITFDDIISSSEESALHSEIPYIEPGEEE